MTTKATDSSGRTSDLSQASPETNYYKEAVDNALVLFANRLAVVQGEYNAASPLSSTQLHAEEAQDEARTQLLQLIEEACTKARIKELNWVLDNTMPNDVTDVPEIVDRLAALQHPEKESKDNEDN